MSDQDARQRFAQAICLLLLPLIIQDDSNCDRSAGHADPSFDVALRAMALAWFVGCQRNSESVNVAQEQQQLVLVSVIIFHDRLYRTK